MPGERILYARWHLGVHLAVNNSVALQFPQVLGQHFLSQLGDESLELTEAAGSAFEMKQERRFPLPADDGSSQFDRAIRVIHESPQPGVGYQNVPTSQKDTFA